MIAILFVAFSYAQEHLTFKGVPIDGTLDEYVANMKKAGFTYVGEDDGIAVLQGDFAGFRNCMIGVVTLKSVDIVNRISVLFDADSDWAPIYGNYSTLKEMLTQKYGKREECIEKFEGYVQPKEDNDKMHELLMDRCNFYTSWETDKGRIDLEIIKDDFSKGRVRLSYWDKINTTTVQAKALDDL